MNKYKDRIPTILKTSAPPDPIPESMNATCKSLRQRFRAKVRIQPDTLFPFVLINGMRQSGVHIYVTTKMYEALQIKENMMMRQHQGLRLLFPLVASHPQEEIVEQQWSNGCNPPG